MTWGRPTRWRLVAGVASLQRTLLLVGVCASLGAADDDGALTARARLRRLQVAAHDRAQHHKTAWQDAVQHDDEAAQAEDAAKHDKAAQAGDAQEYASVPKDFQRIEAPTDQQDGGAPAYTSQAELDNLLSIFKDVKNPDTIRYVPPVPSDGGPLAVGVRIDLVKFQNLDEVAGTVNMVLDLILCWEDERLSFKPAGPAKAGEKLPVTSNLIWTPDIVVLNQVAAMESMFASEHAPIIIADDIFRQKFGVNVIWQRRINLKSRCSIDMTHFPFDRQTCGIIIGSWASSRRQMLLVPQGSHQIFDGQDDNSENIHTSEFQVRNITVKKKDVFMKGNLEKFEEVQYDLVLQRYPHHWMVNYILPMFGVTMLTIATMWMSNPGTRLNSGTRLLLCIVQIMNITAAWRPANETDIWLDRFQTHCLALSIASVVQSCVVDYLKNSGLYDLGWAPRDHVVDTLLRTLICFLAMSVFVIDFCELQERAGNDMLGLYGSFHGHASKLLVGLIYMIFLCLGTSSTFSTLWLVLPTEWWKRLCCKGCTPFASGADKETTVASPARKDHSSNKDRRDSAPT